MPNVAEKTESETMKNNRIVLKTLPKKIALKDLGQNGKLLEQTAIERLIQAHPNPGRFSKQALKKAGINTNYSIVVIEDEVSKSKKYYAIYSGVKQGKALAQTKISKVKFVQELAVVDAEGNIIESVNDAKFAVLKIQEFKDEKRKGAFLGEYEKLKLIGQAIGQVTRGDKQQHLIIEPYIEGFNLKDLMLMDPPKSIEFWIHVFQKTLQAIKENFHDKGWLHCDIKPQNIIYDPLTDTVTFIDVGTMLKNDGKQAGIRGTAGYVAPEIVEKYNKDQTASHIFNEKTEKYALGKTFAEILGLAAWTQASNSGLMAEDLILLPNSGILPPEIYSHIQSMLAVDLDTRGSIVESRQFFAESEQQYPLIKKLIILNINEYINADNKVDFIAALKAADEVLLVGDKDLDEKISEEIKHALEEKDVVVRPVVSHVEAVTKQTIDAIAVQNANTISFYLKSAGSEIVDNFEHTNSIVVQKGRKANAYMRIYDNFIAEKYPDIKKFPVYKNVDKNISDHDLLAILSTLTTEVNTGFTEYQADKKALWHPISQYFLDIVNNEINIHTFNLLLNGVSINADSKRSLISIAEKISIVNQYMDIGKDRQMTNDTLFIRAQAEINKLVSTLELEVRKQMSLNKKKADIDPDVKEFMKESQNGTLDEIKDYMQNIRNISKAFAKQAAEQSLAFFEKEIPALLESAKTADVNEEISKLSVNVDAKEALKEIANQLLEVNGKVEGIKKQEVLDEVFPRKTAILTEYENIIDSLFKETLSQKNANYAKLAEKGRYNHELHSVYEKLNEIKNMFPKKVFFSFNANVDESLQSKITLQNIQSFAELLLRKSELEKYSEPSDNNKKMLREISRMVDKIDKNYPVYLASYSKWLFKEVGNLAATIYHQEPVQKGSDGISQEHKDLRKKVKELQEIEKLYNKHFTGKHLEKYTTQLHEKCEHCTKIMLELNKKFEITAPATNQPKDFSPFHRERNRQLEPVNEAALADNIRKLKQK